MLLGTYCFAFLGSQYNLKESFSSIKLDRREALLAYREPRSHAEVLSRAASLHYNSRFLPGLQKFLIPLLHLLSLGRQGVKFHWKKEHAEAWTHCKMLLFFDTKLYIPVETCPRLVLWILEIGKHSKFPFKDEPGWSQSCAVSGEPEKVNQSVRTEQTKSGSDIKGLAIAAGTWIVLSGTSSLFRARYASTIAL